MSQLALRIINPLKVHQGTVFFFHGSGSTGEEIETAVTFLMRKQFAFPHLKVVFPTAPLQPYTFLDGELSNVWFDRYGLDPSLPEVKKSVENIGKEIIKLIEYENSQGIPDNKIIVGGFSMGGALALHTGLKWKTTLAGVFAISSFLNNDSTVYEYLETKSHSVPELLQFHGAKDEMVNIKSAKNTFDKLLSLGVSGNFLVNSDIDHSFSNEELSKIYNWISHKIPFYEKSRI